MDVYRPSAVVLQCGADSLAGDKLGCFNITMNGHAHCVQFLRSFTVPLILLGGGGYTVKNVARTWTYETACALGIEKEIDPNLPWNEYFEWFGPRYRLEVPENNMDDLNIKDGSLDKVRFNALHQLAQLRCAPSVEMHDVPRDSLGKHLGLEVEVEREDGAMDDLDRRLARKQACLTFFAIALTRTRTEHARYLYRLQEATAGSEESDEERCDSDGSSYRRSRKRMSILTNRYFNVDPSKSVPRRRFFKSAAKWDETYGRVRLEKESVFEAGMNGVRTGGLAALMETGGRSRHTREVNVDEDWEDGASV